jgi:hypothetical protein
MGMNGSDFDRPKEEGKANQIGLRSAWQRSPRGTGADLPGFGDGFNHGTPHGPFLALDPGLGAIRRPIYALNPTSEAIARWPRQPGQPRDGAVEA